MARGRHRKPPPGPKPAADSQVTGKRSSQAKNERYARPLPLQIAASSSSSRSKQKQPELTWSQWACGWAATIGLVATEASAEQQEETLIAYWDDLTASAWVQVTVPIAEGSRSTASNSKLNPTAQVLWDAGFFGKGSLSRSEPTWRIRKLNEEKVKKQREWGMKVFTSEELTASRRKERMHAKIERARLAVKAGQQLPDGIVALGGTLTEEEEKILAKKAEKEVEEEGDEDGEEGGVEEAYGKHIPGLIYLGPKKEEGGEKQMSKEEMERLKKEEQDIVVEEMEWLQVSGIEVFFLAGMLGVLEVRDQQDQSIDLQSLYETLLSTHLAPPLRTLPASNDLMRPDNPFLLNYIAYHHYRSLGWGVKSGLKFCCDWLLYKRGPVFGHAEFAILIIPTYEDPSDEFTSPFPRHPASGDRDWVWFSTMNRVQTQVLKTLVLCHITIPSMKRLESLPGGEEGGMIRSPEALVKGIKEGEMYSVKEVSLRRWVPARMRG